MSARAREELTGPHLIEGNRKGTSGATWLRKWLFGCAALSVRRKRQAAAGTEMWYGVFLWALVSSLSFHIPAGLLALFTLRHHKYGAAIAGVYRAAAKQMIPFEALTLGVGQTFCVMVVSFSRILATL
ncbi:transmembrane protein 170A isoform X3 [Gopherus evgoodei]|uniref:transmembrane protein 170A isoform X3 n=2 Tax=Testudinoidea TaxID=8486 RepID=UPI0011CF6EEA|nr:transmembrane protein 170A isoform X3 [Gopherus evgoodei]